MNSKTLFFLLPVFAATHAFAANLVSDGTFTLDSGASVYNGLLSTGSPWTVTSSGSYGVSVEALPNGLGPIDPLTAGSPELAGPNTPYFVSDDGTNTLSQTLTGFVVSNTYEVSFDAYLAYTGALNTFTPSFSVQLGGTSIANFPLTSLPIPSSPSDTTAWVHFYNTFTATSTSAILDFSFVTTNQGGAKDILLQRVYVGDVVSAPEPSSIALLLTGFGSIAFLRRRKSAALRQ